MQTAIGDGLSGRDEAVRASLDNPVQSLPRQRKSATDTLQSRVSLNDSTGCQSAARLKKLLSLEVPVEAGRRSLRRRRQSAPRLKQRLSLNVPVEAGPDVES